MALAHVDRGAGRARSALKYLNVKFGYLKFLTHALDNVVWKLLRRDAFLFRHTDPEQRHSVYAGITAFVYDKVLHGGFGVDPECADPDQIYDWVHSHGARGCRSSGWNRVSHTRLAGVSLLAEREAHPALPGQ